MQIKKYFKNSIQVFAMITSLVILVNLFLGNQLTNGILWSIIGVALLSALLTFILYDFPPFNRLSPMVAEIVYLLLVLVSLNFFYFLIGSKITIALVLGNAILVGIIYLIIRWVSYSEDKKEAEKINQALKNMREGK